MSKKQYRKYLTILEEYAEKHNLTLAEKDDILMNYANSLYRIQLALHLYPNIRYQRFLDHLDLYEESMQSYCNTEQLLIGKIEERLRWRNNNER